MKFQVKYHSMLRKALDSTQSDHIEITAQVSPSENLIMTFRVTTI